MDGDRSSYQGIQPDMASIAAAGPKYPLFATLQTGHLTRSVGLGELWYGIVSDISQFSLRFGLSYKLGS